MFACKSIEDARKVRDEIISSYGDVAEEAMNCLENGFESSMSIMVLPNYLRKYFRTSNQIERLNKELKRLSKAIGIFPNETSLMRLMGAVLVEQNELLSAGRKLFKENTYRELMTAGVSLKLITIAQEQRQILVA